MAGLGIVLSHIRKSLQWLWFAEELKARDIEHFFILIHPERPLLADDLERTGVPVYYLPHGSAAARARAFLECARLLRRHRPEVLHTSLPHGNLVGQLAGVAAGVRRRVTTCENASWAQDHGNWKHAAIDRLTYRLAGPVITLTSVAARHLEETYGVASNRLVVIPHALKAEAFRDIGEDRLREVRRRMQVDDEEFTVGMVARMEGWKGHRYAVEAMRSVVAARPDVRLVVLGVGGDSERDVRRQVAEAGLERQVRLIGFVEDTLAAYRAFSVQLHVPVDARVETGGIAILEGMLSGCAQVLTLSGFATDTARHMENAWVVDYRSAGAIAEALIRLHDDALLRRRLGETARKEALQRFDYRAKVDRHLEVYGVDAWRSAGRPAINRR